MLPAIRKTGAYTHQPSDPLAALKDPATLRGLLLSYSEQVTVLQDRVEVLAPKAAALDRISSAEGSVCITEASKMLKVNPRKLFVFMRTEGWIYRRAGGKADLAYQSKLDQGLLEHKPYVYRKDTDYGPQDAVRDQVMVTPKGLAKLAERLETLPLLA